MINYEVNKNKGTVAAYFYDDIINYGIDNDQPVISAATITGKYYWVGSIFNKCFSVIRKSGVEGFLNEETLEEIIDIVNDTISETKTFSGVAKVSPEDTFNADIGMRIAKTKLLKAYYKAENRAVKNVMAFIKPKVMNAMNRYEHIIAANNERIAKYDVENTRNKNFSLRKGTPE